ncbi:hypothetical protein DTO166G4_3002 [Paecilomyces variotii]|nr:hypothetical protein DTO166G4_3002 [Paecilomyces variotii]KAJ9235009.1 hypothetical protein DTO166G5_4830 [Paecilomyces variotii]KAJ9348909.1 hypothetical protein DTO027B9_7935 [Paecilomyces variotii]KAJ9367184.1 hypothetical protein DTO282E5_8153 [Paecilomyces variotii]KAJ9401550.1 hypothetical protein DTO282F9_1320 [Paecilomyces variotii]
MDAQQQSRRARSSSDMAQGSPVTPPQRPRLGVRTISAPAGDIQKLDRSKGPAEEGKTFQTTVIEESESPITSPVDDRPIDDDDVSTIKGNNQTSNSRANLPHVRLAVIGSKAVGKSTFVQCALDMKHPPTSHSNSKKMSLDGTVYMVRLLEIALDDISFDTNGSVVWPRTSDDNNLPPVDGALILHDVTSPGGIIEASRLLSALTKSSIPYVLVQCKCDLQDRPQKMDAVTFEKMSRIISGKELHRTAADSPRTQKRCISILLRSIVLKTPGKQDPVPDFPVSEYPPHVAPTLIKSTIYLSPLEPLIFPDLVHWRCRAASASGLETSSPFRDIVRNHLYGNNSSSNSNSSTTLRQTQVRQPLSPSQDWQNCTAAEAKETAREEASGSETIASNERVDGNGENRPTDKANGASLALNAAGSRYVRSNSHPVRPQTPPSAGRLDPRRPSVSSNAAESPPNRDKSRQRRLQPTWRHSAGSDAFSSFLDMEDDENGEHKNSPDRNKERPGEYVAADTGVTFEDLVDRLVSVPMSKQDSKFSAIFLCLYRKFAAPGTLLNALINRFEKTERSPAAQLSKSADQLRLLNVVGQWVSEYPGDFAYPKTRRRLTDFVAALEKNHVYMFAAKEIASYLDLIVEEDETGWPFRDSDSDASEKSDRLETFLNTSARSSPMAFLSGSSLLDYSIYNTSSLDLNDDIPDASSAHSGHSMSLSNASSHGKSASTSNQSFSTLISVENAQREAQTLELTPKISLTKIQWRQFMEIPDDDFAKELTRIDWIMYNSFRPRDLVRHVSISSQDKDKIKSLANVNRMIKEFNHVAFFVASMILFRDKPKHRAKALEKFMNIAQRLRRQNNYNSLGAVIAGINGTPVHRLTQTRELVPLHVQKEFMRLVILMGTQKSHFAYRLAWENSFAERIPFLPLHRRDLVSAEEGNKTFVGEDKSRVNWKKFEIMGEVVLGIQRSQKTPYPYIPKHEEVMRLLLETKLSNDEEDLYSRSMQVEPSATGDRKKFAWLRS